MCGICGVFNADGKVVTRDPVVRMRDALSHRGPDAKERLVRPLAGVFGGVDVRIVDMGNQRGDPPSFQAAGRQGRIFWQRCARERTRFQYVTISFPGVPFRRCLQRGLAAWRQPQQRSSTRRGRSAPSR